MSQARRQLSKVKIQVYADASYSPSYKKAVAGYLIIGADFDSVVETKVLDEVTNIRAELVGVLWALESISSEYAIHLYTDCKAVYDLPGRRRKLEAGGFVSLRTGRPLANGELYRRFLQVYDERQPEISWVAGHKPSHERNDEDAHFRLVDKTVRKVLRQQIKRLAGESIKASKP